MPTERYTIQHESMVSSATGTITVTFAEGPKTDQYRKAFLGQLAASGWTATPEGQPTVILETRSGVKRPTRARK